MVLCPLLGHHSLSSLGCRLSLFHAVFSMYCSPSDRSFLATETMAFFFLVTIFSIFDTWLRTSSYYTEKGVCFRWLRSLCICQNLRISSPVLSSLGEGALVTSTNEMRQSREFLETSAIHSHCSTWIFTFGDFKFTLNSKENIRTT